MRTTHTLARGFGRLTSQPVACAQQTGCGARCARLVSRAAPCVGSCLPGERCLLFGARCRHAGARLGVSRVAGGRACDKSSVCVSILPCNVAGSRGGPFSVCSCNLEHAHPPTSTLALVRDEAANSSHCPCLGYWVGKFCSWR